MTRALRSRPALLVVGILLLAAVLVGVGFFAGRSTGPEGEAPSWLSALSSVGDSDAGDAPVPGDSLQEPSIRATPGDNSDPGASPDAQSGERERPSATARPGSELVTVSTPPEKTLVAVKLPDGFTAASFAVSFEPYGWGAEGPEGPRLVILITEATPDAGAAQLSDLNGRNALVEIGAEVAELVSVGGSYTGTLDVRADSEGRGALHLEGVRSAQ